MFTKEQTLIFENVLNFLETIDSERLKTLFGDENRFVRWLKEFGVDEVVKSVSD